MHAVSRTLYRELLRAARRVRAQHSSEALLDIRCHDYVSSFALPESSSTHAHLASLAETAGIEEAVRAAFRQAPADIDLAFGALRTFGECSHWLEANRALHTLAASNAPAEAGACVIADALSGGPISGTTVGDVGARLGEFQASLGQDEASFGREHH